VATSNVHELGQDKRDPYHHGALREALIDAGVQLAREGGPDAIVLREVARRIGVSPNAAYRHFHALPELLDAIADEARDELARAVEIELTQLRPTGDAQADALTYLLVSGQGYVHFALAEPGLFATAWSRPKGHSDPGEPAAGGNAIGDLLEHALGQLVAIGLLAESERATAFLTAWSAAHGLSALLLGPLRDLPAAEREAMIVDSLTLVCRGLTHR
jgi:AcrR family transcriptional regulator